MLLISRAILYYNPDSQASHFKNRDQLLLRFVLLVMLSKDNKDVDKSVIIKYIC